MYFVQHIWFWNIVGNRTWAWRYPSRDARGRDEPARGCLWSPPRRRLSTNSSWKNYPWTHQEHSVSHQVKLSFITPFFIKYTLWIGLLTASLPLLQGRPSPLHQDPLQGPPNGVGWCRRCCPRRPLQVGHSTFRKDLKRLRVWDPQGCPLQIHR